MLSGPLRYLASILGVFRDATRQLHEFFQRKVEKNSSDLIDWIATGATHEDTISRLHGTICERLAAEGVPLGGSLLAFEAFHPVIAGRVTRWIEGQPVELTSYEAGAPEWTIVRAELLDVARAEPGPARWRLTSLLGPGRWSAEDGIVLPVRQAIYRSVVFAFFPRAEARFTARHRTLIREAAALAGPLVLIRGMRINSLSLLGTYVGPQTTREIFAGNLRRGEGRTIRAVLLLGDLRGFTRLTEQLPSTSVIDILNRWFEILEKTVVAHGGEILKFMGDGFLAMFAIDQEREVESCCGAVAAVASALPHLDAFIAELRRTERITVGYGVTLHAGTVVYGNVGGRERLDFTVIGPAVNRVSRLQEVAKLLGEPVLASRDVAQLLPDRFASLGAHPLRDLDGAMEVFRLVRSTGPSEVAGPPFSFKDSGLS